jgi:drug/metabolite transporter (DMT)-like permease
VTDTLFAAALASALLHAAWNAALKSSPNINATMSAQLLVAAAIAAIGLAFTGLPSAAAWPFMLASSVCTFSITHCLLNAYQHGSFGIVYPMNRSISVVLVLASSVLILSEPLRAHAIIGVVLISAAVLLFASGDSAISPRALAWTGGAALFTAIAVLVDAKGARNAGSVPAYAFALTIMNFASWSFFQYFRGQRVASVRAELWPRGGPIGVAATASYLLILWVWTNAPIALGAALRDTSAVFAALISWLVLKEKLSGRAAFAILFATLGAVLIRLA